MFISFINNLVLYDLQGLVKSISMSLVIVEKNLLKASDIVLGLVSIWLFTFRDVICLFDLVFTLIRDLTAYQVCLEICFVFTEKCFVVL